MKHKSDIDMLIKEQQRDARTFKVRREIIRPMKKNFYKDVPGDTTVDKAVITLRGLGWPVKEIAALTGLCERTVRRQWSRFKKMFGKMEG